MEPEGMTKFCETKVMMKRPPTRTAAMEETASGRVSFWTSSSMTGTSAGAARSVDCMVGLRDGMKAPL